jgi:hypothetical protein
MRLLISKILLLITYTAFAQKPDFYAKWKSNVLNEQYLYSKDFKDSLKTLDFSTLWTRVDNGLVYGFIGENFQRLKIKLLSVEKDAIKSDTYHVLGKSMVKNNVCQFRGTIKIEKIRLYKKMHWGVDDEFKKKGIKQQGVLVAKYHFDEDSGQTYSGTFEGTLISLCYIDKNGQIEYDDVEKLGDSYRNNQFNGTWTDLKTKSRKVCNWGDYRIPYSSDLDIGAGEFSPADKYLKYGWQTYRAAFFNNDKNAEAIENKKWWE